MDYTNVNTYEWVEQDLRDWENALQAIRKHINTGEFYQEPGEFQDARLKIAGILEAIQSTREMIQFKRDVVEGTTADVDGAFDVDPSATPRGEQEANRHWQGEDTLE